MNALKEWVDRGAFWELEGRDCHITIERRPPWCDRGRFLAKIFTRGVLARDVDQQDGWPRYFFDLGRCQQECEAWLDRRQQRV